METDTEPDWKKGDILEMENEFHHIRVRFEYFILLDRRSFHGEVIRVLRSKDGLFRVGDRETWRTRGFRLFQDPGSVLPDVE